MDIAGPCLRARYPSELDALCMHDLKFYLPDDILTKVDRMSMAVSLEVRPPILDHRVVEFAFRLPPRLRLRGRQGKYILKRLLERYLPRELVYRPKQGFAVPLEKWFRSDLRELLLDALNPEAIRRAGIFNEKTVKWVIDMHMRDSKNYASKLWQILAVQVWASRSSGASVHADTGGRVFPAARYRT
jgi:asparagine synthase (glutamine-hydrolysing)